MVAELVGVTLDPVDSSANDIQARRLALGLSVSALAKEAKVDRSRIDKLEDGDQTVRPSTAAAVVAALDRLEGRDELPEGARYVGDPGDNLVEFEITGNFGVKAIVKGPIRDLDALQAAAAKLVAGMQVDGSTKREMP